MIVDRDEFEWASDVPRGREMVPEDHIRTPSLTADQVLEIRHLLKSGRKQMDIAAQYGVSNGCISDIKHHKTWNHI